MTPQRDRAKASDGPEVTVPVGGAHRPPHTPGRGQSLPHRSRLLPRGGRDVARQAAIWLGFACAYEIARGLSRSSPAAALHHAREVISIERSLGAFFEPELQQHAIDAGQPLIAAANWTYWIAEFAVITLVLCWVYLRRTEQYFLVRDALIATNLIGFVGYVLLPTAPPRLVPGHGFVDTLATSAAVNHGTPLVAFAANRYAAMPSLHTADALVIGVAMAILLRRWELRVFWLVWPVWVSLALIVTANHFWLDSAAGVLVAVAGGGIAILSRGGKAIPRGGHDRPGQLHALRGEGRPTGDWAMGARDGSLPSRRPA